VGNKKVYIINNAEKLNVSSSNSLLKFLEEPPEGIIAILITNNMYQLLNTIISRCQILSFKKNNGILEDNSSLNKISHYLFSDKESLEKFVNEEGENYINTVISYIEFLEKRKTEAIAYKNKEFLGVFSDRKSLNLAFDLFVLYYKDVLNNLLGLGYEYFNDYASELDKVSSLNDMETISKKIRILIDLSINIKFNLNANLLVDKLVIKFSEV
jgi:DNA polymerase-3 subunit delta'